MIVYLASHFDKVPWALSYSSWYHQYPRFPIQALSAASLLTEYTLTDRGTWLSSAPSVTDALTVFAQGTNAHGEHMDPSVPDPVESDALLNPCSALLAASPMYDDVAMVFMGWLVSPDGGQRVVSTFEINGKVLYAPAHVVT